MSEPIVFISRNRVKEGKLEALTQYYRDVVKVLWDELPGTLTHLAYASDDGSMVSIVHVFPDAAAMDRHMVGVPARMTGWSEFAESAGYEIYGSPSERTMEAMRRFAGTTIPLTVWPSHLGGWIRLAPG